MCIYNSILCLQHDVLRFLTLFSEIEQATSLPFASVACFLQNEDGSIYGLTCKHVLLCASNGIYVKYIKDGQLIAIGHPHSTTEKMIDIGLFKVNTAEIRVSNIIPEFPNDYECSDDISLYDGNLSRLYGREVFKLRTRSDIARNYHFETKYPSNIDKGTIIDADNQLFFWISTKEERFSERGESGTAVVVVENSKVKIIGMVIGGEENRTCCVFMPAVIQLLERNPNLKLHLYKSDIAIERLCMEDKVVIPGTTIYVQKADTFTQSPEKISPLSINMHERAMLLLCCKYDATCDVKKSKKILMHEKNLKRLVNDRGTLNDYSIFPNGDPHYVVIDNGLQACDALYTGNVYFAEKRLKTALLAIRPTDVDGLGLRLMAKLLTYVTWYELFKYNNKQSLVNTKELLDEGREFYETYKHLKGFPHDAGMYFYYDTSRYHLKQLEAQVGSAGKRDDIKNEKSKAISMAKAAVKIAEEMHQSGASQYETVTRLVLMKSEYASTVLCCGGDIWLGDSIDVSKDDMEMAETALMDIKKYIKSSPKVQALDYYTAQCDLLYRQGKVKESLKLAKLCYKEAIKNRYKEASEIAWTRIVSLEALLKHC